MSEEKTRKSEPLRCPFCGAVPEVWHNRTGSYFVECTNENCGVNPMTNPSRYREGAIGKWNRREGDI